MKRGEGVKKYEHFVDVMYGSPIICCPFHYLFPFAQQRNSALLGDTDKLDDTYDAYEKDIAVVSFYFEKPTVFEYARFMQK